MKHSSTFYFVQAKLGDKFPEIIGHSKDEETGEVYYKFLDKKKAKQLLENEKKVSPEYQYRIVKETITHEWKDDWV